MIYITMKQSPKYEQLSIEDFLFEMTKPQVQVITHETTDTKTYKVHTVSERFTKYFDIVGIIDKLAEFNRTYDKLRAVPRHDLYHTFHIPKKSGGLRRIDAPNDELMDALRCLKTIFENDCRALYHTSAFAYIKGRSTISAVKRHQVNNSQWFGKYDLSNFFGSTTLDFVLKMFGMVYPFSDIVKSQRGKEELSKALDLAFLDGGLPQGTPISPLITNIMMIPIDFELTKKFRDSEQNFVNTRYADDFIISSKQGFSFREVEKWIVDTLSSFGAPFTINSKKTRYGSRAGRNWNLGVMLNQDNKITVGHQKKRKFQAMLSSYIMDKKNGKSWDLNDVQIMMGYLNYFKMVEGDEPIDGMINHIGEKFGVNVMQLIKSDLRA